MWKAVQHFIDKGILIATHGRGTRIASMDNEKYRQPDHETSLSNRTTWHSVYNQFKQHIVTGEFSSDTFLPSPKELSIRYGVCYRTMQKVISRLRSESLVSKENRKYRIRSFAAPQSRNTIILIARRALYSDSLFPYSRTFENLRALEHVCSRLRIDLDIHLLPFCFGQNDMSQLQERIHHIESGQTVLGIIIWTIGMEFSDLPVLLRFLSLQNRPTALLDENGEMNIPSDIAKKASIQRFGLGTGTKASEQIAQYLITCGHCSIAYISPLHQPLCSRNRLLGLQRMFDSAGLPANIHIFTLDEFRYYYQYESHARYVRNVIESLITSVENSNDSKSVSIMKKLQHQITMLSATESFHEETQALFEEAIQKRTISAWVTDSDTTALEAIRFLQTHGYRVPEDISVVGFDDSLEAFFHKLTSFNFNVSGIMNAMVHHILHAKHTRSEKKSAVVEIDGFLNIRESVCPKNE